MKLVKYIGRALRRHRVFAAAMMEMVLVLAILGRLPLPREDFAGETVQSLRILDRRGMLLRECLNDGQGRAQWKPLRAFAPALIKATIAVEDRRFFSHPGVDPVALVRATATNLRARSFKSGGSTLTQQVIRNVYHQGRTLPNKLLELWYALRLEGMMSKDEILEQYLNRVPYGNQLIGAEAASRAYFGKPASDLSLAESAYLAGLPNAPSVLNPWRKPESGAARQNAVLRRLLAQKEIAPEEYDQAIRQPLQFASPEVTLKAAHVTDMMLKQFRAFPGTAVVRTTVDYALQQQIQLLMRSHIASLTGKNVTNAAAVVMDNATGEIRALVGSLDYFDERHSGEVNGALAMRQPGSAIKPLMYGLALEHGYTPADVLADVPTAIPDRGGDYVPENYDRKYHGPVRLRTALACSYNVPAVRVLRSLGKDIFLQRLHEAGITTLTETPEYYGYGLTLGNGEVNLLELSAAYAALANGGVWKPPVLVETASTLDGTVLVSADQERALRPAHQVYESRSAFLITDILSDPVARRPAFGHWFRFPFACAAKTGTTKDYRDNWTLGYTTKYTVGVWVGNFDGSAMHGVSGVSGAGTIFTDIMYLLHTMPNGLPPGPFNIPADLERRSICAVSGRTPGAFCTRTIQEWFSRNAAPLPVCEVHQGYRIHDDNGAVVTKVFESFPPEFSAWAATVRVPAPPSDAVRIPGSMLSGLKVLRPFSIVTPANGDCFKLDPVLRGEYQNVRIIGSVPERYRNVRVRVDRGMEIPYRSGGIHWRLQRGAHSFQLVAKIPDGRQVESKRITVYVQ